MERKHLEALQSKPALLSTEVSISSDIKHSLQQHAALRIKMLTEGVSPFLQGHLLMSKTKSEWTLAKALAVWLIASHFYMVK